MNGSDQTSLRYAASLQLHQLDQLVGTFGRCRTEAVSILQRLITANTQRDHVARLRLAAFKRPSSMARSGDRALMQAESRCSDTKAMLESTLDQMKSISTQVSQLASVIAQDVGQIHTNSALSAYSLHVSPEMFNYEYGELQKTAELIRQEAQVMNSEIQVKVLQYRNCEAAQYQRLLSTWNSSLATKDQNMDDLADLMLS